MSMMETDSTAVEVERDAAIVDGASSRRRSRVAEFVELTKPRLTMLSVLTTLAGIYVGSRGPVDPMTVVFTLCATFLVGGGCGALNMYAERDHDRRMRRTMNRPLPSGRIEPAAALVFGLALVVVGVAWLALSVNLLAAAIALATVLSYVLLYTPLKRLTTLNTIVGGLPGALPPLIGWAAAGRGLDMGAAVLFAILFFWQMPHFLSLAWMYRKDYLRAGYRMLTAFDEDCSRTSRQILIYTAALVPLTLLPTMVGIAGFVYFFGAFVLGVGFLAFGLLLALGSRRNVHARWLFYYSLLYLPVLLLVMVLDRGAVLAG